MMGKKSFEDTGSKRTGESKTAIMENTNQRLKLELEDKEIEHQGEEDGEINERKASSEGEDEKKPVNDLKHEVTNGNEGLEGLNDSRGSQIGHSKTKNTAKKRKASFGDEFESRKRQNVIMAWDMRNHKTDRGNAVKIVNCQVQMPKVARRCHFNETLIESCDTDDLQNNSPGISQNEHRVKIRQHRCISRMQSEMMSESTNCKLTGCPENHEHIMDRGNALSQFDRSFPSALGTPKQRSRKGIPCRRRRENAVKFKKERCKYAEKREDCGMNDLPWKRSSKEEPHAHPIQTEKFEYREKGELGELRMSLKNHDILGRNVLEIEETIPVEDNKHKSKNTKTLSSGRYVTTVRKTKDEINFGDIWINGENNRCSILTGRTSQHQSYEDYERFLYSSDEAMVEPEIARKNGKEISLNSPVHKTLDSAEMSRRQSHFRSFSTGYGKQRFIPGINYHPYMTVSNALPNLPSLPWRRFENVCNDMLPVQLNHPVRGLPLTSDRMKTYPKFLKGKVEEPASSSPQSSPCQEDGSEDMAQTEQTIQQGKCGASKNKMAKETLLNTFPQENVHPSSPSPSNSEEDESKSNSRHEVSDYRKKSFGQGVEVASSSPSTPSRDKKPPVIRIPKNTSNGYSHYPLRRNQLRGEATDGGRPGSNNPWGKGSYSDLITMALASCAEKKMTLDEIYRWITLNIPYFKNKGEEISSSGWKNSIRHTLSVRQRFVRLPRVTNGSVSHKSWWTLSDDFLRKRTAVRTSSLESLPSVDPDYKDSKQTQTQMAVCEWCSRPFIRM